jgi:hypothetical protein
MSGVRAELEVPAPRSCPVAQLSADADADLRDVTWTRTPAETEDEGEGGVNEQFRSDADLEGVAVDGREPGDPDGTDAGRRVEPLFERSDGTVYRIRRDRGECVCTAVESLGVPVHEVRACDGGLVLTVYLAAVAELRDVVDRVRDGFGDVRVRRLAHADGEGDPTDVVPVDRGVLTDRQTEVLRTAHAMGYFEHPRESNATEVAEALGVCPSTLVEHLSTALGKLLEEVFVDDARDRVRASTGTGRA